MGEAGRRGSACGRVGGGGAGGFVALSKVGLLVCVCVCVHVCVNDLLSFYQHVHVIVENIILKIPANL